MTRAHGRPPRTLFAGAVLFGLVAACSARSPGPGADSGTPIASAPEIPSNPASQPGEPLVLYAIGDSIPYNLEEDCPGCTGFVDSYALALEERLGRPVEVNNYSRHDGAETFDIVQELASQTGVTELLPNADVIIVSIGFNDQPPYRESHPPCPEPVSEQDSDEAWVKALAHTSHACVDTVVTKVAAQAGSVFARLRDLAPDAAVGALTSYDSWNGWDVLDGMAPDTLDAMVATTSHALRTWNAALCKEAKANDVVCVDVYRAFNGRDGSTPAGDLLANDYTHPSQAGNDLIRDLLLESGLGDSGR